MSKKKPYYPNNWAAFKATPSSYFETISFNEFMDWKIAGWELPSSVSCIIREKNLTSGKIKEYTYSRAGDAKRRCRKIMDVGESEFIVCTSDAVHIMYPELVEDYDDPLR
tara:strand:- start:289 stop:618 length:330 start_codon:yes stop_codon:yes gene_type:complete